MLWYCISIFKIFADKEKKWHAFVGNLQGQVFKFFKKFFKPPNAQSHSTLPEIPNIFYLPFSIFPHTTLFTATRTEKLDPTSYYNICTRTLQVPHFEKHMLCILLSVLNSTSSGCPSSHCPLTILVQKINVLAMAIKDDLFNIKNDPFKCEYCPF